jgi:transposase
VLFQDECHLVWGDVCGYVWGRRNTPITVPMTNERQRQTYYGTVNLLTHEILVQAFPAGNGAATVDFLRGLRDYYGGKPIILLWDGATYHRDAQMKALLAEVNADLPQEHWAITCLPFAPNAPDQNPIEDIWLQAKNFLRKHFAQNKTFAQVKACFTDFLCQLVFDSVKFDWYVPDLQII